MSARSVGSWAAFAPWTLAARFWRARDKQGNTEASLVVGGMLIQQVSAFLTGILIARALGAGDYGIFNILRNIVTALITLAPLGLDLALLKHGPRYSSPGAFRRELRRMRAIVLASNAVFLAVLWFALGSRLETNVYHHPGFGMLMAIALVGVPFAADIAIMGAAYKVDSKPGTFALLTNYVQPIVRLGGAAMIMLFRWSVRAAITINSLAYVVSIAVVIIHSRATMVREHAAEAAAQADDDVNAKRVFSESLWMAMTLFVNGALRVVDTLVLGAYVPSKVVGAYGALSSISQLVAVYPMAVSQTLGPNVSRHFYAGDMTGVRRVLGDYIKKASRMGGFVFGGVAAFGDHLDLVFGPSFHFDPLLACLMPLGWLVSATLSPTGYALSMTGYHRSELAILIVGGLLLVGGCFALVPPFGAIGAACAVLLAFSAINFSRFAIVSYRLGFVPGRLFDLLPPVIAALIGTGCKIAIDGVFGRHFVTLVLGCVLYSIIFGALFYAEMKIERRTAGGPAAS